MISNSNGDQRGTTLEDLEHQHIVVVDTTLPDTADALDHAANTAVAGGMELEAFMQTAFAAYLAANPGKREEMENKHAIAHLEDLRRRGVIGTA